MRPTECRAAPQQSCRSRCTARAGGSRPCFSMISCKASCRAVLHHVVEQAVVGAAEVVDLDDAAVRQDAVAFTLALELLEGGGVRGVGANDFDGAKPAQELMLGEEDLAMPPREIA